MILRQVRKDCRFEMQPRQALLVKRVRGAFHHHIIAARTHHARKHAVQRQRIRRRVLGGKGDVVNFVMNGAQQTDLFPGILQNIFICK
jgi:hypothetical protein